MTVGRVIQARSISSVLLLAVVATGLSSVVPAHGQAPSAPNIIVIQVDDLDLRSYVNARELESGDGTQVMWRLRNLSNSSSTTNFANSFASYPLCCPSRATFLTGQYAHNHGVIGNGDTAQQVGGCEAFKDGSPGVGGSTVPLWLRSAMPDPYRTGFFGKYLNGYGAPRFAPTARCGERYVPPGWETWEGLSGWRDLQGDDHMGNAQSEEDYFLTTGGPGGATLTGPWEDYQTDKLSTDAVQFITSTPVGTPFYLHLAPTAPHRESGHTFENSGMVRCEDNVQVTPSIRPGTPGEGELADGFDLPQAGPPPEGSFDEANLDDKPTYMQGLDRYSSNPGPQVDCTTRIYQERIESLRAVDRMIGALTAVSNPPPNGRDTYFFFTSDNGFFLGQHRLQQKELAYEEAIRVPLMVYDPRTPAACGNRTLTRFVVNTDLAPTIAELAGVAPPPGFTMDGQSLVPFLEPTNNPTCDSALLPAGRRRFLIEHWEKASAAPWPTFFAVRTSDTHEMYLEAETGESEYYDLNPLNPGYDPWQRTSTHEGCTVHCDVLSGLLEDLMICGPASPCAVLENQP
jgi:arylsulfatase A-like enzyme